MAFCRCETRFCHYSSYQNRVGDKFRGQRLTRTGNIFLLPLRKKKIRDTEIGQAKQKESIPVSYLFLYFKNLSTASIVSELSSQQRSQFTNSVGVTAKEEQVSSH